MSEDKKVYPKGKHPNSLKHLTAAWNSETAKEAQLLGAAKKKANRIAREQLKMSLESWKQLREEVSEDFSSVELLRVIAMQKIEQEDIDGAAAILAQIAEFERPKLARTESKVEEVKADEMSDEELRAKIQDLLKH